MTKNYYKLKRLFFSSLLVFLFGGFLSLHAQSNLVTELTGNPPDLSDWTNVGVDIEGEEIILTQAASSQQGALFYSEAFNLNQCIKWKIEFDFRIYGGNPNADGLAFWYLENPPQNFGTGGDIGMPAGSHGLKVVFDTYDNDNYDFNFHRPNPEIQVYYGTGYSEENNVIPHADMLLSYWPGLVDPEYQHAVISWDNGYIEVTIDGEVALSGDVQAFNGVENIEQGYFGFSSSTGLYYDRHSLKNVKVYNNAIDLTNELFEIAVCDLDGDGFDTFDLTQIEDQLTSDELDMVFYFFTEEDAIAASNPILDPYNFTNTEEGGQTLYIRVENLEGCFSVAQLEIIIDTPPAPEQEEITLATCISEGVIEVEYDLTLTETGFFEDTADLTFTYYHSEEEAMQGDTEQAIENPDAYFSEEEETISVRVDGEIEDCYTIVKIHLQNIDPPVVQQVEDLEVCGNVEFVFDLTQNDTLVVGDQENMLVSYYVNEEDAIAGENAIENPEAFATTAAACETIYVRIQSESDENCFSTGEFQVCGFELEAGQAQDLSVCLTEEWEETAVFNLAQNDAFILDGLDAGAYQISYYTSEEDAQTGENEIGQNYETSESQVIYYRMENEEGCYALGSFNLYVYYTAFVEMEVAQVCLDRKINLNQYFDDLDLNNYEIIGYYLSLSDLQNDQPLENPEDFTINNTQTEIYASIVSEEENCPVIYHLQLHAEDCEILIPEGFSPNGDGINDYFEISGLENSSYTLKIYSRYGRLIFEGNQDSTWWDGNSKKGKEAPTGTYYYVLKSDRLDDTHRGWVYLNR